MTAAIGGAERLCRFTARAAAVGRPVFRGRMTYAAAQDEEVDWDLFDIVGIDYYGYFSGPRRLRARPAAAPAARKAAGHHGVRHPARPRPGQLRDRGADQGPPERPGLRLALGAEAAFHALARAYGGASG
jgi:hypothetical protein